MRQTGSAVNEIMFSKKKCADFNTIPYDMCVPRYISVEQYARIHHVDTSVFQFVSPFCFWVSSHQIEDYNGWECGGQKIECRFDWIADGATCDLKLFSLFFIFCIYASINPYAYVRSE